MLSLNFKAKENRCDEVLIMVYLGPALLSHLSECWVNKTDCFSCSWLNIYANIHFANRNSSYKTPFTVEEAFRANFFEKSVFWRVDFL